MAETRWLDEHEQQVWRAFLEGSSRLFDRLDDELVAVGLSHASYEVLARLSEAPGRTLRMGQLADRVQFSRSRLSHAVARLEERGWVARSTCAEDRRGLLATLTDEGFAVLARTAPVHVTGVRTHLFDQLSPEDVDHLGRIMDGLRSHLT